MFCYLQIHAEIDYHDETRFGSAEPLRFSLLNQFLAFFGVISGSFLLYWFLDDKRIYRPALPKQYPTSGPHYTFESK